MTAFARLALFAALLVVVFLAAVGTGRALGPSNETTENHGGHPAPTSSEPR